MRECEGQWQMASHDPWAFSELCLNPVAVKKLRQLLQSEVNDGIIQAIHNSYKDHHAYRIQSQRVQKLRERTCF